MTDLLGSGYSVYGSDADAAADKYGIDRNVFRALIQSESSWNPSATSNNSNGTVDYGIAQLNSRYFPNAQSMTVAEQLDAAAAHLKSKGYDQDAAAAVAGYNGSGPAADAYSAKVMALAGNLDNSAKYGGNPAATLAINAMFPLLPQLGNITDRMLHGQNPFAATVGGLVDTSVQTKTAGDKLAADAFGKLNGFIAQSAPVLAVLLVGVAVVVFSIGGAFTGAVPNVMKLVKAKL